MKKLLMLLLVGSGFGVFAQKPAVVGDNEPGWKHIGQVTASFKTTNESIIVIGADEFQAIKLKVNEAPIHIERLQVFYESGQMEELEVKSDLSENAETRVINLSNPQRDIKKVSFTYRTLPNATGEKADVALYGLKTGAQGDAYLKGDVDKAKREAREESRELREDAREVKREANEEAREMKREVNEEANEVSEDVDDAKDEVNSEAREAEQEVREESNEVRRDTDNANDEMRSEAREAESTVSEKAAKVMAAITDKKHESKVGPDGQTIFVDDDTKYYYINNDGEKVFVTKLQLKDKPNND